MGLILFGTQKIDIGCDELLMRCPSCEQDNFADVMITSCYFHTYHVPIFPTDKEANIVCQACGLKRYETPFNATTFKNYPEIKGNFRHPLFTYAFAAIFLGLILIAVLFSMF